MEEQSDAEESRFVHHQQGAVAKEGVKGVTPGSGGESGIEQVSFMRFLCSSSKRCQTCWVALQSIAIVIAQVNCQHNDYIDRQTDHFIQIYKYKINSFEMIYFYSIVCVENTSHILLP